MCLVYLHCRYTSRHYFFPLFWRIGNIFGFDLHNPFPLLMCKRKTLFCILYFKMNFLCGGVGCAMKVFLALQLQDSFFLLPFLKKIWPLGSHLCHNIATMLSLFYFRFRGYMCRFVTWISFIMLRFRLLVYPPQKVNIISQHSLSSHPPHIRSLQCLLWSSFCPCVPMA